jgi:transcription elongation regulator 1
MVTAKNEFRSLLRETKVISYKSHNLVKESEKHYNEIIKVLENDKRYLVLECVAEERERILQDFMRELHLKGPPPPPTASNPSERLRKL